MFRSPLSKLLIALFLLACGPGHRAWASHIVGGEMTYRYLGGIRYEIRLALYRDCLNGQPSAIAADDPAIFSIFSANGNKIKDTLLRSVESITVPRNFENDCVLNAPNTCLNRLTFRFEVNLPFNSEGYEIVYQRCCRNDNILNINQPGISGATYFCTIPGSGVGAGNSSALFKQYPPQIICINNPLVYDHSATDANGDSLTYEFCQSYIGGSSMDATPTPEDLFFSPVSYIPPFSSINPMGGSPQIRIDRQTGLITGTPNIQGLFVVTVCCNEYRSGVLINVLKREFQFTVTNCSKAVVADIPIRSEEPNTYVVQCYSNTVTFQNLSTGANEEPGGASPYFWDFGVPGVNDDTSREKEPTFTYPDSGIYIATLWVNRGSTCPDSISRFVKVFPTFNVDFSVSGLNCPDIPKQFTDLTETTYRPITLWAWSFGDGTVDSTQNPVHIYRLRGNFQARLISRNLRGCLDTQTREVYIEDFRPRAGNDTIIVKGEIINFNATGGIYYRWSPPTWLSDTLGPRPVGFYPEVTRLDYSVFIQSEAGCTGYDTINVWVVNQAALYIPTAFSPNGDGRNDLLKPIGIGYSDVRSFRIYNRFGEEVFVGGNFAEGWDGTYRGQPADIGTYYWSLDIVDKDGKPSQHKGDVSLIR